MGHKCLYVACNRQAAAILKENLLDQDLNYGIQHIVAQCLNRGVTPLLEQQCLLLVQHDALAEATSS